MKKYFLANSEKEVCMGDVINFNKVQETDNGVNTFKGSITLCEEAVPFLLEIGAIVEQEVEEEEEEYPFLLEELEGYLADINQNLICLMKEVQALRECHHSDMHLATTILAEVKDILKAQSKKK